MHPVNDKKYHSRSENTRNILQKNITCFDSISNKLSLELQKNIQYTIYTGIDRK